MAKGKHSSAGKRVYNSRDIYSDSNNVSLDIYSSSKRKQKKGFDIFLTILFIIECIVMIGSTIYIATMELLPVTYIIILGIVVAFICGLQMFLKLNKKKKKATRIISLILSILVLCSCFFSVGILDALHSSVVEMTDDKGQENIVKPNSAEVTDEPFLVYLSGLDTRNASKIPDKGLSDVNIVVAVDPERHKVLMVNTPRDYYVPLYGDKNKMDKLTHAGNKGIECSMQTLEALYDIEFNYYGKVTFNSLIEIVDALGGITVESEHNFTAYSESGRGYKYVKGKNNLNGDQALAFVRERKSFSDGDRQRGRNQQIVIRGIIDKALSPSILNPSKFKELLSSVTSNVETNFATDEITALFRMQLKDMSGWDIQSIAVDGKGSMRPTYSSSASLSVIIPDQSTVDTAKNTIKAFLKGETYTEPENTEETETSSKSK